MKTRRSPADTLTGWEKLACSDYRGWGMVRSLRVLSSVMLVCLVALVATPSLGAAAQPTPAPPVAPPAGPAAKPTWQDSLDGKADSGATGFSGPRSTSKTALDGVTWVPGSAGQAASFTFDNSFVGYVGSRLKADQGTILFKYRPIPDLAGAYATRHASWLDYGQYKPPPSGFLL